MTANDLFAYIITITFLEEFWARQDIIVELHWRRTLVHYIFIVQFKNMSKAEKSYAVQVSDTTMLNIVEKAGNKNILANNKKVTISLTKHPQPFSSIDQN